MVLKICLKIYEKIYQGEKEGRRGDPLESGRSEVQSLFLSKTATRHGEKPSKTVRREGQNQCCGVYSALAVKQCTITSHRHVLYFQVWGETNLSGSVLEAVVLFTVRFLGRQCKSRKYSSVGQCRSKNVAV